MPVEHMREDEQEQQRIEHRRTNGLKADLEKAQHFLVQQGAKTGQGRIGSHGLDAAHRCCTRRPVDLRLRHDA